MVVTFQMRQSLQTTDSKLELPKDPPTFAGIPDTTRSPSCMFAGIPDGTAECAKRIAHSQHAKAGSKPSPSSSSSSSRSTTTTTTTTNCTTYINTRKYVPECHVGEVANVGELMGMNARTHAVAGVLSGRGQAAALMLRAQKDDQRKRKERRRRRRKSKGGRKGGDDHRHGGSKVAVYDLLVTGVGGSGTNLAASALKQHAGVVVGHESFAGSG